MAWGVLERQDLSLGADRLARDPSGAEPLEPRPQPGQLTRGSSAGAQFAERRRRSGRRCFSRRGHGHGSGEGGGVGLVGSAQPRAEASGWVGGQRGAGAGCGRAARTVGWATARIRFLPRVGSEPPTPPQPDPGILGTFPNLVRSGAPGEAPQPDL